MPQLLTDAHSLSPAPHLPILPAPPVLAHLQPISKATAVTQASIKDRDWLHSHQQAPEKGHQSQTPHASALVVCVSCSTNPPPTHTHICISTITILAQAQTEDLQGPLTILR